VSTMEALKRTSTTGVDLWDAFKLLDRRYFAEDGSSVKSDVEFGKVMQDYEALVRDKRMKNLRNDLRAKIRSFVSNGDLPFGMSNVDIMGSYIIGDKPKKTTDLNKRSARLRGQELYVESLVHGFNELIKEKGFNFDPNNDYDTPEDAYFAIEADSMSAKGPYDNGSEVQAIETVNANLQGVMDIKLWDVGMHVHINSYFKSRLLQIQGHIHKDHKMDFDGYVEYMQSRGLKDTMRGWPFYASGSDIIREHQFDTSKWMFEGIDIVFPKFEEVSELTIDEFISRILKLLNQAGIKSSVWFNLRHTFIIPISRNQGSAWKIEIDGNELTLNGDRKDMKYRLVTPISAFVQAYCILGLRDFVTNIVKTTGRIGLESPAINDARMNQFITDAKVMEQILISTDYTAYDSHVKAQELAFSCALGIALYDDEWVQDAFSCAASSLTHKIMILPTSINDPEGIYENFTYRNMDYVKGDKNYEAKMNLTAMGIDVKFVEEGPDYRARAFYIYTGYLPSGHIYTNSGGSEVTLLSGTTYTKCWLFQKGYITEEEFKVVILAIASGDDLAQGIFKRLYDALGYDGVLKLLEVACKDNGQIVKAAKQIHVLYRGFPVVDFLQKVRLQMIEENFQQEYRKYIRQALAYPYIERYSKLPFIGQYVIVIGKSESGLCALNTTDAAKVLISAGKYYHSKAQEISYKPPVSPELAGLRDKLQWDSHYTVYNSSLLGMEQLLGLVKKYGQGLLSELGKYLASAGQSDELIKDFDVELETRAPHRAVLARAMYRALGKEFEEHAGASVIGIESEGETFFYAIEMMQKMLEMTEESVNPVILVQQKQAGIQGVDVEDVAEDENPDEYEIGA